MNPNEFVYDRTEKKPEVVNVLLSDGQTIVANSEYEVSWSNNIDVPTTDSTLPTVTVTAKTDDGCNYSDSCSTTFTINPQPVTLTWINSSQYTYTGEQQNPTATVNNVYTGDTCNPVYAACVSINVGRYTYEVTGLDNTNYILANDAVTEADYEIVPAPVTITWIEPFEFTYDGNTHVPKAEAKGLIGTDQISVSPVDKKDVGLYEAEIILPSDNYEIAQGSSGTHEFEIVPKTVELKWSSENPYIYNGSEQCPTAEATNLVTGDTCTVTVEPDRESIHTGKYTAKATELSDDNYVLPTAETDITLPYEIAPLTAELAWTDTELVYNRQEQIPKATVANIIGSDVCEVVVVSPETNVGSYTAQATELKNDYNDYKLPDVTTQAWTIIRKKVKPIKIKVNGPSLDPDRLGGPDPNRYHTIDIDAEPGELLTITLNKKAVKTDFTAGTVTIENDAIYGEKLDTSGDVVNTIVVGYNDKANLTNDSESAAATQAPEDTEKFVYDLVAKKVQINGSILNRGLKEISVTLSEKYSEVLFESDEAGQDFYAGKKSLSEGTNAIGLDNPNPKLKSTTKYGSSVNCEYWDSVGNYGSIGNIPIEQASGTIEIKSVSPSINDAGRIGQTASLTFQVSMNAPGGYDELASGSVFGGLTLQQGEHPITVSSSRLVADSANTPSLAFDDLKGSATFRSFIYDAACDDPILTMEPYAGCYYLMGLAEPYSQLTMTVAGSTVTGSADAFGVFALKMPLTEAGDLISLRVVDQAGNVAVATYTVGQEGDPVEMLAYMGGRVYSNAHGNKGGRGDWTMVLTASVDDLKAGNVNVPIIAGNMVSVGTVTVKMDEYNNLSYSYTLDDGVEVLKEAFIANTTMNKDDFIAGTGIEVSPSGTLITDIQKGKVYLSLKMLVKVPADMLKATFQTEKIKDNELKRRYRDIQSGKLN